MRPVNVLPAIMIGLGATALSIPDDLQAQQQFPVRPVRIVNPFSPGGSVDLVSRSMAAALTEMWNQQAIVDNRPGAGTTIGTDIVSHAEPDGYTVLCTTSAIAIMPSMYSKLRFDTIRDLTPINLLVTSYSVLIVHPAFPVRTVKDLIALAKAQPGKIPAASSGIGSTNHLVLEMFKSMADVDLLHVPYKGGGPALADLIGGQVKVFFNAASTIQPLIQSGRVRGIAVSSLKRLEQFPDLPTIAEAGVPGFEAASWYALYGPKALREPLVRQWNDASNRYLRDPRTIEFFRKQTMTTAGMSAAEFADYHRKETERWGKVVKSAGLKPL